MKKLLVIANPYPPMASAGTTRVVRFLRHLPDEGWEPTVLTAQAEGPAAVPPGVRVVRAAVPWPKQLLGGGRRSTKVNRWVAVPDPYVAWVGPAVLKGREILERERFDVIMSSSPRRERAPRRRGPRASTRACRGWRTTATRGRPTSSASTRRVRTRRRTRGSRRGRWAGPPP